ncbi:MAG: hypothetical protein WCN98_15595, partial [Verrucomicrobiaceae bacterium]
MNKSSRLLIVTILGAATLNGIAQTPVKAPARRPHDHHTQPPFTGSNPQRPQFGDPLPGLAPDQLAAFFDGKDDFTQVEDVEGGLGPIFNRDSCVACHSQAGVGGGSNITVTRFGRMLNGVFDPLTELGGSLLQENSILGHGQE